MSSKILFPYNYSYPLCHRTNKITNTDKILILYLIRYLLFKIQSQLKAAVAAIIQTFTPNSFHIHMMSFVTGKFFAADRANLHQPFMVFFLLLLFFHLLHLPPFKTKILPRSRYICPAFLSLSVLSVSSFQPRYLTINGKCFLHLIFSLSRP